MKWTIFLLMMIFTLQGLNAQKVVSEFSAIDLKALQIPDSLTNTTRNVADYITANFKTDESKVRAIFIWIASTIKYDVENMFAINLYETTEEKISTALQTKKGICQNYAALFNEICLKSGLKSFTIEGYTKQNGFADYLPHAWCGVLVDSNWFIFDPTWGSGYVNNGKFFKKINNAYFKGQPEEFIKSHMPFDPLWQFLNYPVTSQEFNEGKTGSNNKRTYFNYPDSIKAYVEQDQIGQLSAASQRIEKNGVKNSLTYERLAHIKREIEVYNQNEAVGLYNSAIADYNEGLNNLNAFIRYRNQQFKPGQSDVQIQNMLDSSLNRLVLAQKKLERIKSTDATTGPMINTQLKSIEEARANVNEQQEFLKKYLSKGKSGRKSMFYKTTWFGIRLN